MMMAQSVFETYKSNERVTYVSISPQMFSMLAKLNIDDTDPEAKEFLELISQINTFKLLRTDEPTISDDFSYWTQEYAKTNQLTELMQVREGQTTVYFYAALSEKENIVDQLVMLAQEDNDNAGDVDTRPTKRRERWMYKMYRRYKMYATRGTRCTPQEVQEV